MLLELKDITHSFNGVLAVDHLSFSVRRATATGIIGPNGAGKTTAFNVVSGFLTPTGGKTFYGNEEITGLPPSRIARAGIARTFQDLRLIRRLTVLDNVLLSRPKQRGEELLPALLRTRRALAEEVDNRNKAEEILKFVDLIEHRGNLAADLSYGQQKLLSLACCVASEAELLLLDEPVSGIHPRMIEKVLELVKELTEMGKTILFIEHNIEAVRRAAEHVIVMNNGQNIAEGPPADVLDNENILAAYLE